MRQIVRFDRDLKEKLEEMWAYLNDEYGTFSYRDIASLWELCFVTTLNEFISSHYILNHDLEEYLHYNTWEVIDLYVWSMFDNPDCDVGEINETLSILSSMGNSFACRCLKHSGGSRKAETISEAITVTFCEMLEDGLRNFDIISLLPDISSPTDGRYRMVTEDIEVNIVKSRIILTIAEEK